MWTYKIVEHSSMRPIARVEPKAASFTRILNAVSTGGATFNVRDGHDWLRLTAVWAMIFVAEWDGVPQYAGYVIDSRYSKTKGEITIKTECVRTVFARRLPFAVIGTGSVPEYPDGTLKVDRKTWPAAVREILRRQAQGGDPERWNLPLVLPADATGGVSRTFWNYEFWTIEQMLSELQNAEGGPDLDFDPRWSTAGTLEWVVRVGSPRLSRGRVDWHVDASRSAVTDFDAAWNGQKSFSGVHTIGKGSEKKMPVGKAGAPIMPGGTVFLDGAHPYKEISNLAQLNAQARSDAAAFGQITQQWSFKVEGSGDRGLPAIGDISLGLAAALTFSSDPIFGPSTHLRYVISYSCDMTNIASVEVQDIGPN
ncbi:hypothetical protein [Mycetocola tolaasinivorans]|uniref:hypothetical protein n=1 Tax=Mycetocola tolaasinivorans TaxID=76635 RepID=UPI0016010157|nr:hypothetical protein [Mycetocola tolaasinivorans]